MSSLWRVACVRIPRFPVGAVWRANQGPKQLGLGLGLTADPAPTTKPGDDGKHWDDRLLALADGTTLRAVTAAAGRVRVRAGMTGTAARARCTRLDVLAWDEIATAAR